MASLRAKADFANCGERKDASFDANGQSWDRSERSFYEASAENACHVPAFRKRYEVR